MEKTWDQIRAEVEGRHALCAAVRARQILTLVYQDTAPRLVEPRLHGHTRAGREVYVVWQRGPGEGGWRILDLALISKIEVVDMPVIHRAYPDPDGSRFGLTGIHCAGYPELSGPVSSDEEEHQHDNDHGAAATVLPFHPARKTRLRPPLGR